MKDRNYKAYLQYVGGFPLFITLFIFPYYPLSPWMNIKIQKNKTIILTNKITKTSFFSHISLSPMVKEMEGVEGLRCSFFFMIRYTSRPRSRSRWFMLMLWLEAKDANNQLQPQILHIQPSARTILIEQPVRKTIQTVLPRLDWIRNEIDGRMNK